MVNGERQVSHCYVGKLHINKTGKARMKHIEVRNDQRPDLGFSYHSPKNGMANSRVGAGEIQDEFKASYSANNCSDKNKDGGMSKGQEPV